jgi:hypothetical protein
VYGEGLRLPIGLWAFPNRLPFVGRTLGAYLGAVRHGLLARYWDRSVAARASRSRAVGRGRSGAGSALKVGRGEPRSCEDPANTVLEK